MQTKYMKPGMDVAVRYRKHGTVQRGTIVEIRGGRAIVVDILGSVSQKRHEIQVLPRMVLGEWEDYKKQQEKKAVERTLQVDAWAKEDAENSFRVAAVRREFETYGVKVIQEREDRTLVCLSVADAEKIINLLKNK